MSSKTKAQKKSYAPLVIIFAVLVAALATGLWMLRRGDEPASAGKTPQGNAASGALTPPAQSNLSRQNTAPTPASSAANAPAGAQPPRVRGPETAAVTIEEFGDYQCPPCGRVHPFLSRIERDYGDRVRLIFRHLPLQNIHKNAALAARSAEAAGLQGKFWEMHDMLYEHQREWSDQPDPRPVFTSYAQKIGLNVEKFKTDTDSSLTGSRLGADSVRANALRVGGTPTIFLNGRQLTVEQTLDESKLRGEIEAALGGQGK